MRSRGSLVATAVLAIAAVALLWLVFSTEPEVGAVVEPGPALVRDPDRVAPPVVQSPALAETVQREARDEAAAPSPRPAPLRGQVVDERTGEPVPLLEVTVRRFASKESDPVTTGEDGRFETDLSYESEKLRLEAHDPFTEESLARLRVEHDVGAEPLEWKVPIGPTYRLRFVGGTGNEIWDARVVEIAIDGAETEWPLLPVTPHPDGGDPWIRYARVHHEPTAGSTAVLRALELDEMLTGEAPLATTVGVHPVPVQIAVRAEFGGVRGHVSDEVGEAVEATMTMLLRAPGLRDEQAWRQEPVLVGGDYSFERVPPGTHRLMVVTDHRPVQRYDVEVVAGKTAVHDVVLPVVHIVGDVRGALLGPLGGGSPTAFLRLESVDAGATNLASIAGFTLFGEQDPAERSEFAFEGLPGGRYRVTIFPFDGRSYDRISVEVTPPAETVLFTASAEPEDDVECVLRVRDAASGAPVPGVIRFARFGPFWEWQGEMESEESVERIPRTIDLGWLFGAPGYRPTYASVGSAQRDGERLVIDVALERGYGAGLVIVDAETMIGGHESTMDFDDVVPLPALAGARVDIDGVKVGRSDERGVALVATDAPIEDFDVYLRHWVVLTKHRFRSHAETPDGLGFVLMARE